MTDPIDTIRKLDPLGSTTVAVSGETKHALAEAVMTSVAEPESPDRTRTRGRPWLIGKPAGRLTLAGAVAAVGVLVVTSLPLSPATRALGFSNENGDIVVRVLDVNATAEQYNAEFERRGLDIRFEIIPVSPSVVGKFAGAGYSAGSSEDVTYSEEPKGCAAFADDPCVPIIRIPGDFHGTGEIRLGRPARPGEHYVVGGPIDGRNEALDGVAWRNMTVGQIREILDRRGYGMIEFRTYGHYNDGGNRTIHNVPDDWYVVDGSSGKGPGEVLLWVNERPVQ